MGTDWFVKVKCPRPDKMISNHKELRYVRAAPIPYGKNLSLLRVS